MNCENCNCEHDGKYGSGRFCSQKCARGFSTKNNREETNRKVSKALGGTGIIEFYKCINCGKDIKRLNRKNSKRSGKYCCQKCKVDYEWKEYENLVEENKGFPWINEGRSIKRAKKYLIMKRGDKCEICGITNWNNKKLIKILDHIDGNSNNNNLVNLRLICSNCDSQLDTYKSKNRKSSRKYRSKYRIKKHI